jgi:hypothetical protein
MPEPDAHRVLWRDGEDDPANWTQYHDSTDPLPAKWDDEAPDLVTPLFTTDQIRAYSQAMAEHARRVALEEGFEAGWRVVARDWAMRDDLLADIGSPAYLADMTRAIRAAAQTQGGTS